MKPKVGHYKDEDGKKFDSVNITLQDVISFRTEAWESSYPKIELHLSPKQFKELYKRMVMFYTKKVKDNDK